MASWMKAVLISTGFVATAINLKVIVPAVTVDFSQAPILLSSLLIWLRPPYLYVITNVIIVVIGVSSRYYRSTVSSHERKEDYEVSSYSSGESKYFQSTDNHQQNVHRASLQRRTETARDADFGFVAASSPSIIVEEPKVITEKVKETEATVEEVTVEEENKCLVVVSKPGNQTPVEKPLVTARIGQRKPVVKTSPAERNSMRALKVAKPRRNETLENTWKMITEGKSTLPLTSYYRKPDTFRLGGEETVKQAVLKKSESFSSDHETIYDLPPLVKVKKVKVSRSRDELNRRVEAFIKKCNDERFASMRLDKEVALCGLSF